MSTIQKERGNAPVLEALEPRLLLDGVVIGPIPSLIDPATADQIVFAPGSSHQEISNVAAPASVLLSFVLDGTGFSDMAQFDLSPVSPGLGVDAALALYDAGGNLLKIVDNDPLLATPAVETMFTEIESRQPYILGIYFGPSSSIDDYDLIVTTGPQTPNTTIVIDPATGVGQIQAPSPEDTFNVPADVDYYELDLLNAASGGTVTVTPTGLDVQVFATLFRRGDDLELWEPIDSDFDVNGLPVALSLTPPPGGNLTDAQYLLATAPVGFNTAARSYDVSVAAAAPLGPVSVNPASIAEDFLTLAPSSWGVASASRTSTLSGGQQLVQFRAPMTDTATLTLDTGAFQPVISVFDAAGTDLLAVSSLTSPGVNTLELPVTGGEVYVVCVNDVGSDEQGEFTLSVSSAYSADPLVLTGGVTTIGGVQIGASQLANFYRFEPAFGTDVLVLGLAPDSPVAARVVLVGENFGAVSQDLATGQTLLFPVDIGGAYGGADLYVTGASGDSTATLRIGQIDVPFEIDPSLLAEGRLDLAGDLTATQPTGAFGSIGGVGAYQFTTDPADPPAVMSASNSQAGGAAPLLALYEANGSALRLVEYQLPNAPGQTEIHADLPGRELLGLAGISLDFGGPGSIDYSWNAPDAVGVGVGMVPTQVPDPQNPPTAPFGAQLKIRDVVLKSDIEQHLWQTLIPYNIIPGMSFPIRLTPGNGEMTVRLTVHKPDGTVLATVINDPGQTGDIQLFLTPAQLDEMKGGAMLFRVEPVGPIGDGLYTLEMNIETTDPMPFLMTETAWNFYVFGPPLPVDPNDAGEVNMLPDGEPVVDIVQNQFGHGWAEGEFTSSEPHDYGPSGNTGSIDVYRFWALTPGPVSVRTVGIDEKVNTNLKIYQARLDGNGNIRYFAETTRVDAGLGDWFPADRSVIDDQTYINDFDALALESQGAMYYVVVKNEQGTQGQYRIEVDTAPAPLLGGIVAGSYADALAAEAAYIPPAAGGIVPLTIPYVEDIPEFVGYFPVQVPDYHNGLLHLASAFSIWDYNVFNAAGDPLFGGFSDAFPGTMGDFLVPAGPQTVYVRIRERLENTNAASIINVSASLTLPGGVLAPPTTLPAGQGPIMPLATPLGDGGGTGSFSTAGEFEKFAFQVPAGPLTINVMPAGTAILNFEAEDFTSRTGGADPDNPGVLQNWSIIDATAGPGMTGDGEDPGQPGGAKFANASGDHYVQVVPEAGNGFNNSDGSQIDSGPQIEYAFNVPVSGTYNLQISWDGFDGGSDSLFASVVELKDGIGSGQADWYRFAHSADSDFATIPFQGTAAFEGTSAGGGDVDAVWDLVGGQTYTLRLTPREDGVAVDAMRLVLVPDLDLRWGIYVDGDLLAWDQTRMVGGDFDGSTSTTLIVPELRPPLDTPQYAYDTAPYTDVVVYVEALTTPTRSGDFAVFVQSDGRLPMRNAELTIPPRDYPFAEATLGFSEGLDGTDWVRLDVPVGVVGDVLLEVAMSGIPGGGIPMRYDLYDTNGDFVSSETRSTESPDFGKLTFELTGAAPGTSYYLRAGVVGDANNVVRLTATAALPKAGVDFFGVPLATRALYGEEMRRQAMKPDGTLGGTVVQPFDPLLPGILISEAFWVGTPGLATFSMELSNSVRPWLALYRGKAVYNGPGENPVYTLELVDYVNSANVVNGNEYYLTAYVEPGMYALKAGRASGTGIPSYSIDIPDYVAQEVVLNPNSGASGLERHLGIDSTRDGFGQYEVNQFVAYRTTFFHVVTPAGSQAGVTATATTNLDTSLLPSDYMPGAYENGRARIVLYRWEESGGYYDGLASGLYLDPPGTSLISVPFGAGVVYPFREFWVALNRENLKEIHKIGVGLEFVVPQSGTPELIVEPLTLLPNSGQTLAKATVRNIGFASTSFFNSRFQYTDTSENPDKLTTSDLADLPMGPLSSRHRSMDWIDPQRPQDEATYIADFKEGFPAGAIEELDETNNTTAKMLATVDPHRPTVTLSLADPLMDGTGPGDGVWGRYISGVPGVVTDLQITGNDPDGDLFRVTGHFPPFNPAPEVDYLVGQFLIAGMDGSQDVVSIVNYSFGNLRRTTQQNPNRIEMIVKDEYGLPSDEATMTIHVEGFPGWLDDSESSLTFDAPNYLYVMQFHNSLIDVEGTIDSLTGVSVPFIGDLENKILAEIAASGTATLDPSETVTANVTAHGQVTILGEDIINETYTGSTQPTDHFYISSVLFVDKQTLDAQTLAVTFELIDLPLFNFESPEIVLFAYGVPGVASINANLQFLLDATLDAAVTIGIPINPPIIPGLMSPSFVAPTVTAGLKIAGEIEILGFDIAELAGTVSFGITPAFGLTTPPSQLVPFQDFFNESGLDILGEISGNIAAKVVGIEVFSFDLPSANFNISTGGGVVMAPNAPIAYTVTIPGGGDPVGTISGDPAPNLVIDPITSEAVYLQLVDVDTDPNIIRNNLAFSQRQGAWGSLIEIPDPTHVSGPVLAMTRDDEDAPAVVVYQSLVVAGDPADTTRNLFFTGQDIRSRYFDGSIWHAEQSLTSDALYDAEPVIAFNNAGGGVTAWVHNTNPAPLGPGGEFDRSSNEIQAAVWDPVAHAWDATATLTTDALADIKPAVFAGDDGTLYVLWLRDMPGGNEIMFSTNTGSGWTAPAALDIVGLPEGGKIGSVAIGSEGADRVDVLLTHSRTFSDDSVESRLYNRPSTVAGFTSPTALEIVAENANFSHLRTVRASDDGALVAYWQQGDGVTNEIFASRIGPATSTWSAPIRLTSGEDLEFDPSVAVDTDGKYQVVYEMQTESPPAAPGQSPASAPDPAVGMPTSGLVGTSSVQLLPELSFSREMGFPNRSLAPSGSDALATARIVNHGPAGDNVLILYSEDSAATGGPTVVDSETVFLAPGDEYEINHSFVTASGPAVYSMELVAAGGLEVVGDGDNVSSAEIEGLGDLTVESVVLSDDEPQGGDIVVVTSTVRNLSSEPIGPFDVELFQGDPAYAHEPVIPLDAATIGGLAPGASVEVVSNWTVPSNGGTFVLTSLADPAGSIPEATDFNNSGHAVVTVQPDAAILDDPVAIVLDYTGTDNVQVTAEIWNIGQVDLTDVKVQLLSRYENGEFESVDVTTIGSLPAGASVPLVWIADGLAGENRYMVLVDPPMEKPDSDSTNNVGQAMVVLQGLSDLEVSNARLDTALPAQNDVVSVLVDVANLGIDGAENVLVEVFATTNSKSHFLVGQTFIEAIDPLSSTVLDIPIDTTELIGDVWISVVADRPEHILEITDLNNEDAFRVIFAWDSTPPTVVDVRVVCGPGGSVEHSIPTGPDQLKNLPWTNISQVKIAFSENVFVEMWSLAVNASESHRFIDFSYDADSFTGTWTFMEPLGADSLQLVLDESVFDMAENVLDGDWFDRASEFPSGNGRPGGAFRFGINVLPGDVDGDNVVGSGDYSALMGQFGLRQDNLATDLNRDGRVGLADFAIIRGNLGNTLPAAAPPATPIAAAPAPVVPVISQLLDNDENSANTDPIAAAASAPAIDLLIESPSANAYIPGAQAISRRLPTTTLYRAATAGYDLRPLSDDLAADSLADDLLIDVLAESPLAVRL